MNKVVDDLLTGNNECMPLEEFSRLSYLGETRIIEKKSIQVIRDLLNEKKKEKSKRTISKCVSAFSNYDGGVLLFGVDDKTGKIENPGVENKTKNGTIRDRLIDIVSSCTTPSIINFSVKKVQVEEGSLFAIVVAPSEIAPHQAKDHVYYGRIDGKSRPLDGQMVQDIWSRIRKPRLEPSVQFLIRNNGECWLAISLWNRSSVYAEDALFMYRINGRSLKHINSFGNERIAQEYRRADIALNLLYPELAYNVRSVEEPIKFRFEEECVKLKVIAIARDFPRMEWEYVVEKEIDRKGEWLPLMSDYDIHKMKECLDSDLFRLPQLEEIEKDEKKRDFID